MQNTSYQNLAYSEFMDDSPEQARTRERMAFDRGIGLLEQAARPDADRTEAIEALRYIQKLWGFLISDLADPENALPERLRADLISIGLWVMREADAIMAGSKTRYEAIIEINTTVRNGLV